MDKKSLADDNEALPATPRKDDGVRKIASCGAPLKGYGLQIRDAAGKALDERRVGHVFISGPNLMTGYHGDPEATAACLGADGWLNTGDMGYVAGGELFITGRYKDIMIVNGRNIWPQDVEWHAENNVKALRSRDTAAFAIQEDNGREVPVLLVQCREASEAGREDIRKAVHAAVYRNTGIDIRIELVPQRSLPFTTSGKLIRSKARQAWLAGEYAMDEASDARAA